MTLAKKIKQALDLFEIKTRDNGDTFVCFKDGVEIDSPLYRSVYNAHQGKLPNDWVYITYYDVLDRLTEYNIATEPDNLQEYIADIVDSLVDVYTSDLTAWLHSNVDNVGYLTEAMTEYEPQDGFHLLSMAQYKAIDEIAQAVVSYLEN